MNGYMFISAKPVLPMQIDSPIDGMQTIANNEVLYVNFMSIIDRFQLLSVSHKYWTLVSVSPGLCSMVVLPIMNTFQGHQRKLLGLKRYNILFSVCVCMYVCISSGYSVTSTWYMVLHWTWQHCLKSDKEIPDICLYPWM